jgi:hypothetical protein
MLDNQITITDTTNTTIITPNSMTTNSMTTNSIILNTYDSLPSIGATGQIIFQNSHFYGYNGNAWKQLDNNNI